jgi:hypothetical protein
MNYSFTWLYFSLVIFSSCSKGGTFPNRIFPHSMYCHKYLAYDAETLKRTKRYDETIGTSDDSLKIGNYFYHALYIWEDQNCAKRWLTQSPIYYLRKEGSKIFLLAAIYPKQKIDTIKASLLIDFKAVKSDAWRVRNFGFGNDMQINLHQTFLNPCDSLDSVFAFDFSKSYYFGQNLHLPEPPPKLQMMYVSKKSGILELVYLRDKRTILVKSKAWKKCYPN